LITPAARRLAAALMLLAPDTPLLFMGEEYGETNPFPFFCSFGDLALIEAVRAGRKREFAELAFQWQGEIPDATAEATFERAKLSWNWEHDPHRAGLRRLYQTLLAARRVWPPLLDRGNCTAELLSDDVLRIERAVRKPEALARNETSTGLASASGSHATTSAAVKRSPPLPNPLPRSGGEGTKPGRSLIAIANLTGDAVSMPAVDFSDRRPILSTAEQRFGGRREQLTSITELAAYELVLWGDAAWM
jgi:maltooligosyltrehalose trehalohydrolase